MRAAVPLAALIAVAGITPVVACPVGVPASIISAEGTRDASSGRTDVILVSFSEPITGSSTPAHWWLRKNLILTAEIEGPLRVRLRTGMQLGPDPAEELRYRPHQGTGYKDLCGEPIPARTISVADSIEPLAPTVHEISGLARQGSAFYTNDPSPPVVLTGSEAVEPGYTVEVWEEANGLLGLQRSSDRSLGSTVASAGTAEVVADLGGSDRVTTLYSVAVDGSGNLGSASQETLALERVAPTLDGVDVQASSIIVTFSEAIARGRDHPLDWRVEDGEGGIVWVESVDRGPDSSAIALNMGEGYDPNDIVTVWYDYGGPTSERYQDRAGNDLPDSSIG